jgi:hypothetical protein
MSHEHFDCYFRIDRRGVVSDDWISQGRYPSTEQCKNKIEELKRLLGFSDNEFRIVYVKEYSLDWLEEGTIL